MPFTCLVSCSVSIAAFFHSTEGAKRRSHGAHVAILTCWTCHAAGCRPCWRCAVTGRCLCRPLQQPRVQPVLAQVLQVLLKVSHLLVQALACVLQRETGRQSTGLELARHAGPRDGAQSACPSWHQHASTYATYAEQTASQPSPIPPDPSPPHLRQLRCHIARWAAYRATLAARRFDPAPRAILAVQMEHRLARLRAAGLRCLQSCLQCCTVQLQRRVVWTGERKVCVQRKEPVGSVF